MRCVVFPTMCESSSAKSFLSDMLSWSTLVPGCASSTACLTACRTWLSLAGVTPADLTRGNCNKQKQANNNGQRDRRWRRPCVPFPIFEWSYRVRGCAASSLPSRRLRHGSRGLVSNRLAFFLARQIREKRRDFERHLFAFRYGGDWLAPDHL